jgi:hypothetical protein
VAGLYEHGDESSGSKKVGSFELAGDLPPSQQRLWPMAVLHKHLFRISGIARCSQVTCIPDT